MITFTQFVDEVSQKHPEQATQENYEAFVKLCKRFGCEDCTSEQQANDHIAAAMDAMSAYMEDTDTGDGNQNTLPSL